MDTERPHRTSSSSTSELFVCFTSRLSSSSMKLSSKSLLSPSRNNSRDPPQISLSSSLSRRLRSNGSMKGGQASPMFPTVGKRRGCGFENSNPEPSSPKVTCIGQVRVKTKKQGKKMRAMSKRSEASFRKTEQGVHHHHGAGVASANSDLTRQNSSSFQYQQECLKQRNQRWVHLPLTICEALREFNCFFPCRSSCMREKGEKGGEEGSNGHGHHHHHGKEGSCGFARWLHVALQEDGEGKGRDIEVVMREEDDVEDDDGRERINAGRSYRRHVFEDIDIDVMEGKKDNEGVEEEKARISICIPPKNALLLMRCRSEPVKMAALANRFWESPVHKDQHEVEDDEDEEVECHGNGGVEEQQQEEAEEEEKREVEMKEDEVLPKNTEQARNSICEREIEVFVESDEHHVVPFTEEAEEPEVQESLELDNKAMSESSEGQEANQAKEEENDEDEEGNANLQGENFSSVVSNIEAHSDLEKPETTQEIHVTEGEEEDGNDQEEDKNDESSELSSTPEALNDSESQNDEAAPQLESEQPKRLTTIAETLTGEDEECSTEEEQQQNVTSDTLPPLGVTPHTQEGPGPNSKPGLEENGSNGEERENREREKERLPECLLLMMCEPKLSMEVSKETWVCSTDFIRWLPERQAGKITGGGGERKVSVTEGKNGVEKKASLAAAQAPMQPPRSSCSFPVAAGVSMAAMIEQKLVTGATKSNGYEPFVLTRCKSEPMRSTAKLAADTCFWKKPHAPPATLGVGAPAGVGF